MSAARVADAAAGVAGMMPELSPVPLGQRHGPWSDRRQAAGADGARTAKRRFRICNAFAPTRKKSGLEDFWCTRNERFDGSSRARPGMNANSMMRTRSGKVNERSASILQVYSAILQPLTSPLATNLFLLVFAPSAGQDFGYPDERSDGSSRARPGTLTV